MLSDTDIAQSAKMRPIGEVATAIGLDPGTIEPYGHYKAKIPLEAIATFSDRPQGRLILVTSINPTVAGEGKTTVTVGLGEAMTKIGQKAIICVREPSLGPCMGLKGGAAGGGFAQVVPMEDINLHFTGDFHAITSAHNLLSAMLDNHLQQGNPIGIDARSITWPRVLDMNDRALRQIVIGLGGRAHGVPREAGFVITVASEVMAILCLASSIEDLKERLGRIIVGSTFAGKPVTARDLKAEGAMAALLKDAIKPNLVQTLENTPALIHGGPFANIAHGTNTVLATKLALRLADFVIQETGFGADLGFEKFCDIVSRSSGLTPAAVVVVATVRALKLHGGVDKDALTQENRAALQVGLENLEQQLQIVRRFGLNPVVAVNHFPSDSEGEIEDVLGFGERLGAPVVFCDVWAHGGDGGTELAQAVVDAAMRGDARFEPLYPLSMPLKEKVNTVVREIYGGEGADFLPAAERELKRITDLGFGDLPICMAKTQYSLSDDPSRKGRPTGFRMTVRDVRLNAGSGFVVAICGDVMTMPGLPKSPAAERIDLTPDGRIVGLF